MNKKNYLYFGCFLVFVLFVSILAFPTRQKEEDSDKLNATVISVTKDTLTVQDDNSIIYTFHFSSSGVTPGEEVVIEYTGLLNKSTEVQKNSIVSVLPVSVDEQTPKMILNGGIFGQFSTLAKNKVNSMSLDEKIGQMLLVQYPTVNAIEALKNYKLGGYLFFAKDFQDKSESEVQQMMKELQKNANIPLLTAVDEEGGTVVRVSSNPKLASTKFSSPSELYQSGGFDLIQSDTVSKSKLLNNLGINVNLAPVVDVSVDDGDYIHDRALGENTTLTSQYAETVIKASKGTGVSYVLKHFPGYARASDPHAGEVTDSRTYSEIETNDLPPFESGIEQGAEAVLVSHLKLEKIDSNNPASLSPSIHNLLRNNLNFSGVIMTDDLSMSSVSGIDQVYVKAIQAGNDILMISDYETAFNQIKNAVNDGSLSEDLINNANLRIIAWKYSKGLMYQAQK